MYFFQKRYVIYLECRLKTMTYEKFWDSLVTLENLRKLHINVSNVNKIYMLILIVNFIDLKPITVF